MLCPKCFLICTEDRCQRCDITINEYTENVTIYTNNLGLVVKRTHEDTISSYEKTILHEHLYDVFDDLLIPASIINVVRVNLSNQRLQQLFNNKKFYPPRGLVFFLPYNMYGEIIHALLYLCAGCNVKICIPKDEANNRNASHLLQNLYNDLNELLQGFTSLSTTYSQDQNNGIKRSHAHRLSLMPPSSGEKTLEVFREKIERFIEIDSVRYDKFSRDYVSFAQQEGLTIDVAKDVTQALSDSGAANIPTFAFWLRYFQNKDASYSNKNLNFDVFLQSVVGILKCLNFKTHPPEIRLLLFGDKQWLRIVFNNNLQALLKVIKEIVKEKNVEIKIHMINFTDMYANSEYLNKKSRYHYPSYDEDDRVKLPDYLAWHEQIAGYRAVLNHYKPQFVIGPEAGNLDMLGIVLRVPIISIEMNKELPSQVMESYFHDRIGQMCMFQQQQWTLVNYGLVNKEADPHYDEHHTLFVKYLLGAIYVNMNFSFR
jgi:hypothetical protein